MGGIQVRLGGIRCLKSRLSTLLHLQCLLSRQVMIEEIHLNFNLNFSLNFSLNPSSSLHNNLNNQRP